MATKKTTKPPERCFAARFSTEYESGQVVACFTRSSAFDFVKAILLTNALRSGTGLSVYGIEIWHGVEWYLGEGVQERMGADGDLLDDGGWVELDPTLANGFWDVLEHLPTDADTAFATEHGIVLKAYEKFTGAEIESPEFPFEMLLELAGMPVDFGTDWPPEAAPLLFAWSIIRSACETGDILSRAHLERTPTGFLLRTQMVCPPHGIRRAADDLRMLQSVTPETVIQQMPNNHLVISYPSAGQVHMLDVEFVQPGRRRRARIT